MLLYFYYNYNGCMMYSFNVYKQDKCLLNYLVQKFKPFCHIDGCFVSMWTISRMQVFAPKRNTHYYTHFGVVGGHFSIDVTTLKFFDAYWWPTLHKDTIHFYKSCDQCQQARTFATQKLNLLKTHNFEPFSFITIHTRNPLQGCVIVELVKQALDIILHNSFLPIFIY